ncbi:SAV_2336 N-terminal domain-related protein [Streptomyces sp. MB09-01]|uniref:SAV_2336 N-terminal domain-related protein n=1 Tax=Streptomyces sp. MB09-01 TaxID=3028666 RepID=UPI0029AEA512|nr:SAV_2336 N-terminal domain-related protein [Streptomyces sp. MB09-01]MDX3534865.1 SAV_2336 N-terminal domain-related protein [Streptomyces sp. MB09-01]
MPPAAPEPGSRRTVPGAPAAPAAPGVRELAALLRAAGLDPSAEELADALWLAGHIRGPGPAAPGARGPDPDQDAADPAGKPVEPEREEADADDPVRLYASGARRAGGAEGDRPEESPEEYGVPVRVPRAAALPRILDIQRALRALQRHRPPAPPTRLVIDEPATAEASARALGLVIPVLRPEHRREATVRLVMDASPSMAVWQDMFDELRSVCERLGAFRDVQVHYLHRLADGTAVLGRSSVPGSGLRSGDQVRDPTGRALTMVVSDCAGPLWREGAAQRLLYRWAGCTPCMVVQPLPQRLWGRSWLPTERGTLTRLEGGGQQLKFRPDRPLPPGRLTGGLTVPVLPPSPTALGAWARLVAGLGTGPVPAEVGRVLADHPAAPVPPPRAVRPPRELVARFRSSAAPRAVQLAVYLSAAPLTLPVMRLVQRTMLPDSEPSDLAEVLLSGLLRRSGPGPGHWYEFVPGVQDVLLGPLGRDEAALVLKHCSEYVLAHFGRGVRNFPALAVSQLTGVPPTAVDPGPQEAERVPEGRLPQAFAQVSAKVVRRYLPGMPEQGAGRREPPPAPVLGRAGAVRAARDRLADAAADGGPDGGARALHEAVAVLRRAVTAPVAPGDPPEEAETELAGALLRLWAAQRDPEVLAEAERAVTGLRTPAARAALGRVLYERALAHGPDAELLAEADREFAAAGATADPALRRDCAVRRAETLIRLSGLRADAGALREARAALEPLAGPPATPGGALDADPDASPDPSEPGPDPELQRALGRVLLALLPRTENLAERTALAEQAAARLAVPGAGTGTGPAAGTVGEARVRVDLAGALRYLPARLEEAAGQLTTALERAGGDPELRVAALVCLARVHRERYARDADPAALEEAAEAYGRARRLIPRDGEAFGEVLPEWGEVLLERARAADGRRFTGAAVRVLRDSRAAVPQSDPGAAHRLVRLATGLRLRHAYEGDPVDLREAEYLLEVAVRHSRSPLERARAWRDHGDVQQEIHGHTRAVERLDRAADSYRRAWRAALEADRESRDGHEGHQAAAAPAGSEGDIGTAVRLAARAQESRGEVLELLARPRAALDAYRSALELWARPGAGAGAAAEAEGRTEALRARVRTLEAGL